jgi:hypothetical protein
LLQIGGKMDQKNLELLKKLKALAERGEGGEKETAMKKLDQLMKKYNVTDIDIDDEVDAYFEFRYHDEFQRKLLLQIMYKVIGGSFIEKTYKYRSGKGSRTTLGIRCTKAQSVQISVEYDYYLSLWKEEQIFLFNCFINKHQLFQKDEDKTIHNSQPKISEEDIKRMAYMMATMKESDMVQRLEG